MQENGDDIKTISQQRRWRDRKINDEASTTKVKEPKVMVFGRGHIRRED